MTKVKYAPYSREELDLLLRQPHKPPVGRILATLSALYDKNRVLEERLEAQGVQASAAKDDSE